MGHGFADTGHCSVGTPIESRQRPLGIEKIQVGIVGHVEPVNTPHIFPPAKNLSDKPFSGIQWHVIVAIGRFRLAADFKRQEQSGIDVAR